MEPPEYIKCLKEARKELRRMKNGEGPTFHLKALTTAIDQSHSSDVRRQIEAIRELSLAFSVDGLTSGNVIDAMKTMITEIIVEGS